MQWSKFAVMIILCCLISACGDANKNQSQSEKNEGYYQYEAIFLPKDEIVAAFKKVSSNYPKYTVTPKNYHVTTEFKPKEKHENFYGEVVKIHITAYAYGEITDAEGKILSSNEGFSVEVSSENENLQELLDSYKKHWHITGSYTEAGKYTENLDFAAAAPLDITIFGTFGIADSDDNIFTGG